MIYQRPAEDHGRKPVGIYVVPSMLDSWEGGESSPQPDGGEGVATRKGGPARGRLKEAANKRAGRWTQTGYEA